MNKHQKKALFELMALMLAMVLGATLLLPGAAHAYTQKETICNQGHGSLSADYLVIHETANPGASAYNHYRLYSRGYSYAVHYVMELDGSVVYHTMADNRKSWSVGNGNSRVVSIELCHATSRADFDKQWEEAVKWAGDYLNSHGWGIDRMISHNDARLMFGGTDHQDPLSYFAQYGKSWNMFKAAVRDYMGTGQVGGTVEQGEAQQPTASASSSKSMGVYATTASALCVRKGPGTGYARVSYGGLTANAKSHAYANGCLKQGTRVTVMEVRGNWARIPSGWICLQYTTYGGGKATATTASGAGTYRVTASALNVRSGAGTGYAKVPYRNLTANAKQHAYGNGCLKNGTRVTVTEVRGSWAKIPSGWVSMDYLARA